MGTMTWMLRPSCKRANVIEIKSPRNCFPLSLIVVDAKTDLQTKASNGHSQGLSQCMKERANQRVSDMLDASDTDSTTSRRSSAISDKPRQTARRW